MSKRKMARPTATTETRRADQREDFNGWRKDCMGESRGIWGDI